MYYMLSLFLQWLDEQRTMFLFTTQKETHSFHAIPYTEMKVDKKFSFINLLFEVFFNFLSLQRVKAL